MPFPAFLVFLFAGCHIISPLFSDSTLLLRPLHLSLLFRFGTISPVPFFLRETFTANAAKPPVETAPATTIPMVAKQNGHIVHLLGGEA
jgi:hypothetical protein